MPQSASAYSAPLRYLARQPIFDRGEETYGYELLFRSGPENFFHCVDGDAATCHTIDFSLLFGPTWLTGSGPAFINCTRNILLGDIITLLPHDRVIVEVLEDVLADDATLAACDRLRRAGYMIALDDYEPTPDNARLLQFADMVKVDFLATDVARQASIASEMHHRGIRLLAEKLETPAQFEIAKKLGYHYFQGYFFAKPQTLTMQDIPTTQMSYVHVWSIANRESFNVGELERVILAEPSLCYRLLRYLNSAAFGLYPIRSIRHALSLLGQTEMRKWIAIVVAVILCQEKPGELIYNTLVRARCCERLAAHIGQESGEAFMTGIVSLMDAVLDRPLAMVLQQLPLAPECKQALQGDDNWLSRLLHLAICCERGAWDELPAAAALVGIDEKLTLELHQDACCWASQILNEKTV